MHAPCSTVGKHIAPCRTQAPSTVGDRERPAGHFDHLVIDVLVVSPTESWASPYPPLPGRTLVRQAPATCRRRCSLLSRETTNMPLCRRARGFLVPADPCTRARACAGVRPAGSRSRSISYGALSSRPGHARPRRQGSEHQPARVTLTRCCWPRTRLLVPLCFYQSLAVRPALDRLLPSLARAARPPAHQLPACRFHQPCAFVNQTKGRSTGRGLAEHGVAKTKLWPVGYKSL